MVTYPKDWTEKTFEQFIKIKRGASPRPIEAYLTKSHNGVNWIKIGDELVHLVEKNHTNRFQALVSEYYPTWKEAKRVLNSMPLDYMDAENKE